MTSHAAASRDVRVLIVGCGQIGSRHLQAVASLPQVRQIDVIDPRPEALQLGRERLAEVQRRQSSQTIRWCTSFEEARRRGALCIVATQAQGRSRLVREIADALGYTTFILEKVLTQSVQELDELVECTQARQLRVWVNCQMRAYPFHKLVKQRLDPASPVMLNIVGGNLGLATIGIHKVDLFVFYDGASRLESAGSQVDPILHRTARGQCDLSGILRASTAKGSQFTLSYAGDHRRLDRLSITSRDYRYIFDYEQRWAAESDAASGWAWRSLPFADDPLISHLTAGFASEILAGGRCDLPTLEESLVAHRWLLQELQPHFSRLLERELECLPVT